MKFVLSHLAGRRKHEKMLYADVPRAYLYAKSRRPTYIKIPKEDMAIGEENMVGRLDMSMYGTGDAAQNWRAIPTSDLIALTLLGPNPQPQKEKIPQHD